MYCRMKMIKNLLFDTITARCKCSDSIAAKLHFLLTNEQEQYIKLIILNTTKLLVAIALLEEVNCFPQRVVNQLKAL